MRCDVSHTCGYCSDTCVNMMRTDIHNASTKTPIYKESNCDKIQLQLSSFSWAFAREYKLLCCVQQNVCQESWEGHILLDSAWKPVLFSFFFHVRFTNSSHRFPISPLSKRQGSWKTDLNPSVSVKWDPPGSKHTLKWLNNSSLKIPLGCLSHATTSLFLNVRLHTPVFIDIVAYLSLIH